MNEEQGIKETAEEKRERYETAFLEYMEEYGACGISIEDWASEHGLDLALLSETGEAGGFELPKCESIRKQKEDFTASFEPIITTATEITPIVRRERLKEDERKRTLKEKAAAMPQEETTPAPAPRKRGRPKKIHTMKEETANIAAPEQQGKKEKMTLQEALKKARTVEQDGILYIIADSDEQFETLKENMAQSAEIVRNTTSFDGKVEIVSSLPEKERKAATEPQEENTLKEKEENMPEKEKKPSFLMMDGKAVLEDEGFHMELSIDTTNAEEIKEKIDLLYSTLERFIEIEK